MSYIREQYAGRPETVIYKSESSPQKVNKILMGTWVGVVVDNGGDRVKVVTAGSDGWVKKSELLNSACMKAFYVDVKQGDAVFIEASGKKIIVDGGPNKNLLKYLKGWQYKYLIQRSQKILIDTVFVSHFDADHYAGLTAILEDLNFEFGDIYHNGIARFQSKSARRPSNYNTDLGRMERGILKTTFNDIDDVREMLLDADSLQNTFKRFLNAVVRAYDAGRLKSIKRLTSRNKTVKGYSESKDLTIEVLGPVTRNENGRIDFPWFSDSSHTRNGHSLVLKLKYSEDGNNERTMLLGGDLNKESEEYLLNYYGNHNPFDVDVAKSCHHGSGDFSIEFMDSISPYATVISSGDNESHAHPRADAVGCAGKYSKGIKPLVFSTELARSVNSGGDVLYGMINCRTDGNQLILAQMKEKKSGADIWDSYEVQSHS